MKVLADCRDFRPRDQGGSGIFWGGSKVIDMESVPQQGQRVILPASMLEGADPAEEDAVFEVLDVEHYPYPPKIMKGCKIFLRLGRKG